jgi:hypothetical protein
VAVEPPRLVAAVTAEAAAAGGADRGEAKEELPVE